MTSIRAATNRWWGEVRRGLVDLAFPPRCAGCDVELADGAAAVLLCDGCRDQLPVADESVCIRCAAPTPRAGAITLSCAHCRDAKLRFDRTFALGPYEGLLRSLVLRFKTEQTGVVTRALLELIWQRYGAALGALGVDVATAAPMHPMRRWERGVNPPKRLAELLAGRLRVPAAGAMLGLSRNLTPQLGLSRRGRFENVSRQMRLRPGYYLSGAHVLLVDDILTTGATSSEAARVLKAAGAAEVTVVVLARTPAAD